MFYRSILFQLITYSNLNFLPSLFRNLHQPVIPTEYRYAQEHIYRFNSCRAPLFYFYLFGCMLHDCMSRRGHPSAMVMGD